MVVKRHVLLVMTTLILGACWNATALGAQGDGRAIVGVDVGAMLPTEALERFVHPGGTVAPFVGYMFNDYIGLWGQLQVWGGKTKERGPQSDDKTTWALGGVAGPRVALPFGRFEPYGTFQAGIFTSLADQALTDTSPGFSTGGGLNYMLTDNFSVGAYGRWNRLYQRVHGVGDAKYVTTGISLTYNFRAEPLPPPAPPPPPPPPVVAQAPPPPPAPRKVIKTFVLRGVHFDFDRAEIRGDGRAILNEVIQDLSQEANHSVSVEGHTDSVGSEEYNQKLSLRRAQAVHDYLVKGGISPSRIEIQGFGELQPIADNATRDGRAQNRRVEIKLLGP